jgi:non-lysosomal glucosylceramidase
MNSTFQGWRRPIGARHPDPFRAKPGQDLTDDGAVQGLPLGGLGTGSIGRDHDGRFARWHLAPGRHRYQQSDGSWLGLELTGGGPPLALVDPGGRTRPDGLAPPEGPVGEYEALFPFAWYRYRPELTWGVRVEVRQWSPVVPGREDESSWPVGCFEVTLTNEGTSARDLTAALAFELPVDDASLAPEGPIGLSADGATAVASLPGAGASFAVAVEGGDEAAARPLGGDGCYANLAGGLWRTASSPAPTASDSGQRPGLLAASRVRLEPGESRTVVFVLAWDLPIVRFGSRGEHPWYRAYTRRFGRTGNSACEIASALLAARLELATELEAWHEDLGSRLKGWGAPDWLLPALCNELYVLIEGGTAWVAGRPGSEGAEEHFGILEAVDYRYYETLDVRYYGSFPLLELWPRLERLVIRDYLRSLAMEDGEPIVTSWAGGSVHAVRKLRDSAPHDLGGPLNDPFRQVNAYDLQDSGVWRDLNPKLVLQVARDARLLGDDALAKEAWEVCRTAIRKIETFDVDGDGLPEHDGMPDQTFDTWPMRGVSAYIGDLWLAALAAAEWLAGCANDIAEAQRLAALRERAQAVVEKALWTGSYYRFDSAGGPASDALLADQLAGTWYTKLLALPEPHPAGRAERALETVLASNFHGFAGGRLGPVNGRSPDGGSIGSEQADEVWTGVGWALTSLALLLGRDEDAWKVGGAIYRTLYEESGLWFRTPEAWTEEREFRASMYHRPLAVWSVYTALRVR